MPLARIYPQKDVLTNNVKNLSSVLHNLARNLYFFKCFVFVFENRAVPLLEYNLKIGVQCENFQLKCGFWHATLESASGVEVG